MNKENMRINRAYDAIWELLANAPAPAETDDYEAEEFYAEAKNFLEACENLGFSGGYAPWAVTINYSFDNDNPVFLFDTEEEAQAFMTQDFNNELEIQLNENGSAVNSAITQDYAEMSWPDGDKIEWNVTFCTDKRGE